MRMVELAQRAAATTLEGVWRELAPIVNEAKKLDAESRRNPKLLNNPWVVLHARWLYVFGDDLDAVKTVYESTQNGSAPRLSTDDVQRAEEVARKLLDYITEGRRRVKASEGAADEAGAKVASPEAAEAAEALTTVRNVARDLARAADQAATIIEQTPRPTSEQPHLPSE
jgi:hypothetical protein